MWREYKDTLLDGTKSFQEMQQLAQRMDLHGCYAIVSKATEARHVGLCGIVVADSSTSYHILDKSDRCIVLPKVSTEIEFELQAGKKMTLFSKE
jgi:RNase P/RNase MRP subunit p29